MELLLSEWPLLQAWWMGQGRCWWKHKWRRSRKLVRFLECNPRNSHSWPQSQVDWKRVWKGWQQNGMKLAGKLLRTVLSCTSISYRETGNWHCCTHTDSLQTKKKSTHIYIYINFIRSSTFASNQTVHVSLLVSVRKFLSIYSSILWADSR